MTESDPGRDMRGVCLEAVIRKALADAWARGATRQEANNMAIRIVREKFPKEPQWEISELIQKFRGELV